MITGVLRAGSGGLLGTTAVAGMVAVASCGGSGAASPGPPAAPSIQEGMSREWVYNPFDSETWTEAFHAVVNEGPYGRRGRVRRPPSELASLLGATPRMDLQVSGEAVRIEREGLPPVDVTLDGRTTSLGDEVGAVDVTGSWQDGAIRLDWDFGAGRTVRETWSLAETGERVVIERVVNLPGRDAVQVTFRHVYDRDRFEDDERDHPRRRSDSRPDGAEGPDHSG